MAQTQSDVSPGEAAFLGSWTRFFTELQSLLRSIDYTQHPNSDFSEYVVDKCEMWIVSVLQLTDHLSMSSSLSQVMQEYSVLLNDLLHHLRRLLRKWNDYLTNQSQPELSYSILTFHTQQQTGRPRFSIMKEQ